MDENDEWGSSGSVEEEKKITTNTNGCDVRFTCTDHIRFQASLPRVHTMPLTSTSELQAAPAAFQNAPQAEFHP